MDLASHWSLSRGIRALLGLALCAGLLAADARHPLLAATVTQIIGAAADASAPPLPIGCTTLSTFNLVDFGSVNTFNTGSGASGGNGFVTAPLEGDLQGRAYHTASNTVSNNIFLGYLNTETFSFDSSLQISTANVPDLSNAFNLIYDTGQNRAIFWSASTTAPCVGACLHVRTFSGLSTLANVPFSSVLTSAASNLGGIADTTHLYLGSTNDLATLNQLHKLTTGLAYVSVLTLGTAVNTLNSSIADDGTFLYIVDQFGTNLIHRVAKSSMTLTDFAIVGVTSVGKAIAYDGASTFYVSGRIAGDNHLLKIDRATMTLTASINLGVNVVAFKGITYDGAGQKVYVFTENPGGGPAFNLRRVSVASFTVEQTLTGTDGGRGDWVGQPDLIHKTYWFVDSNTPSHLHKIGLCT